MSSSVEKGSDTQSLLTGQNMVYAGIAWSVLSLLFFLLFSITAPGEENPFWYMIGTYILETLPFLVAAVLCYRNWRSPQIASGRNVWLAIGLGMIAWFIANWVFGWWELYWGLEPDVSPADLFYLAFYVCLSWGMVLAILPRRLNLERWQWLTVAAIAAVGITLAVLLLLATPDTSTEANVAAPSPTTEQAASEAKSSAATKAAVPDESNNRQPPEWVTSIQTTLEPLSRPLNFFYIVGDVFLLIIASTLLLAFWGGRFVQSWRMIAAATLSLYIADMWSKYAEAAKVRYESGSLLEVFFVFSAVLFTIGAALEFDVSKSTRRGSRRRAKE
ncbi:MAG TPA: hypothetical protein V6C90_28030 [Coleofasciculaceae cyanobacterium]